MVKRDLSLSRKHTLKTDLTLPPTEGFGLNTFWAHLKIYAIGHHVWDFKI